MAQIYPIKAVDVFEIQNTLSDFAENRVYISRKLVFLTSFRNRTSQTALVYAQRSSLENILLDYVGMFYEERSIVHSTRIYLIYVTNCIPMQTDRKPV